MSKKVNIAFSRNQLILLSWLCDSSFEYLSSFENFCVVDTSELRELKDFIDDCIKNSFKFNFKV